MARLLDAELRLMQVVRPVQVALPGPMAPASGSDDLLVAAWHDQARDYLERTAAGLRAEGCRVTTEIAVSPALAGTILDVAGSEQSRLVTMATHGRGGLSRFVLGGVADKVVRGASCPVLVCPASRADRGTAKRRASKEHTLSQAG
jgi:nucleotide-binding universal stress UspA family protein